MCPVLPQEFQKSKGAFCHFRVGCKSVPAACLVIIIIIILIIIIIIIIIIHTFSRGNLCLESIFSRYSGNFVVNGAFVHYRLRQEMQQKCEMKILKNAFTRYKDPVYNCLKNALLQAEHFLRFYRVIKNHFHPISVGIFPLLFSKTR